MKLEHNGIELERRPAGVSIESVWTGAAITLDDGDVRWLQAVALPAMIAAEPSGNYSARGASLPSCGL